MCNLGQGIADKAFAEGISQGISQGERNMLFQLIQEKLEKNMSLTEISEALEVDMKTIESIIIEHS